MLRAGTRVRGANQGFTSTGSAFDPSTRYRTQSGFQAGGQPVSRSWIHGIRKCQIRQGEVGIRHR